MDEVKLILQEVRILSPGVRWFRFVTLGGERLSWQAGHFYRLRMQDERGAFERSYSVANFQPSLNRSVLDLLIAPVAGGRATDWFWSAAPGDALSAKGPYGNLLLPEALTGRLVLVATSVGLAPYLPMLQVLAATQPEVKVDLLLGVRTQEEFCHADEFTRLADDWSAFRLHLAYSRAMPPVSAAFEHAGQVQQLLFTAPVSPLSPADDRVYLCGNPQMIDDIFPRLRELGFSGRQVIREKYVFAKGEAPTVPALPNAEQKALIAEKLKQLQTQVASQTAVA